MIGDFFEGAFEGDTETDQPPDDYNPHSDTGQQHTDSGEVVHTDSVPHNDHGDHSDSVPHNDTHYDHNDSGGYDVYHTDSHADSYTGTHVDSAQTHGDHSDVEYGHTDTSSGGPHVDSIDNVHVDHWDNTVSQHTDVAPSHLDASPPINMKIRFDPGGNVPEPIDIINKLGAPKTYTKRYVVYNEGENPVKIIFGNPPNGITVHPMSFVVNDGASDDFTVTVDDDMLATLAMGTTLRALSIRIEGLADPIG